jgi:cytochrome c-type biogenesis protein CcmH/NrfG
MPFTAVRELEKAVELAPRDVNTLCDLGEAYQRTLNFKSAEAVYLRALQIQPGSMAARVGLGKTYYSLARYDEAKETLDAVLTQNPEETAALVTLGRMGLEQASNEEGLSAARALIERATQADPGDPDAWYDLGRVEMRRRQPAAAADALRRALRISPEHTGAMYQLSRALRESGQTKDAERVATAFRELSLRTREQNRLEEHIRRTPRDWDGRARLAELYLRAGERGLAALMCREIQQSRPDHPRLPALLKALETLQASASGAAHVPPQDGGSFPLRHEPNQGAR